MAATGPKYEALIDTRELNAAMDKLESMDLKTIHADLGEEMVQIIEERFDNSVDPSGRPWRPLKRIMKYMGRKRGPGSPPLKVLHLFRSFSAKATAEKAEVGTPIGYAKFHTDYPENNQQPRKRIPLREFMGIQTDADGKRLQDVVIDNLNRMFK